MIMNQSPDSHSCFPMVTMPTVSGNELSQVINSRDSVGYSSTSVDKCSSIALLTHICSMSLYPGFVEMSTHDEGAVNAR